MNSGRFFEKWYVTFEIFEFVVYALRLKLRLQLTYKDATFLVDVVGFPTLD